ncbi:DUF397 domain-containing protein [Nonomuraea terrae]|uniref:DUF397 domain-containing protein n=1 Tax=Nonomuraea terrae TaxID=2530383 RepID=UPI003791E209
MPHRLDSTGEDTNSWVDPAAVFVRDSKNSGGAVLQFEPEEWAYFLEEIKR